MTDTRLFAQRLNHQSGASMTTISRRSWLALVSGGVWFAPAIVTAKTPLDDSPSDALEREFRDPAKGARPWVYWLWLNGNVSREGITADLEAMKRVGIAGALIMEIGSWRPGPVHFMSAEFRAMIQHAISEAARLGLQIDLNNDDGWNNGGPWITPELAMQRLTWSETHCAGPDALQRPT